MRDTRLSLCKSHVHSLCARTHIHTHHVPFLILAAQKASSPVSPAPWSCRKAQALFASAWTEAIVPQALPNSAFMDSNACYI